MGTLFKKKKLFFVSTAYQYLGREYSSSRVKIEDCGLN